MLGTLPHKISIRIFFCVLAMLSFCTETYANKTDDCASEIAMAGDSVLGPWGKKLSPQTFRDFQALKAQISPELDEEGAHQLTLIERNLNRTLAAYDEAQTIFAGKERDLEHRAHLHARAILGKMNIPAEAFELSGIAPTQYRFSSFEEYAPSLAPYAEALEPFKDLGEGVYSAETVLEEILAKQTVHILDSLAYPKAASNPRAMGLLNPFFGGGNYANAALVYYQHREFQDRTADKLHSWGVDVPVLVIADGNKRNRLTSSKLKRVSSLIRPDFRFLPNVVLNELDFFGHGDIPRLSQDLEQILHSSFGHHEQFSIDVHLSETYGLFDDVDFSSRTNIEDDKERSLFPDDRSFPDYERVLREDNPEMDFWDDNNGTNGGWTSVEAEVTYPEGHDEFWSQYDGTTEPPSEDPRDDVRNPSHWGERREHALASDSEFANLLPHKDREHAYRQIVHRLLQFDPDGEMHLGRCDQFEVKELSADIRFEIRFRGEIRFLEIHFIE